MMDEKSVTLSFPHLKCSVEWMCDFMATMVTGVFVKMKDTLNRLHNLPNQEEIVDDRFWL